MERQVNGERGSHGSPSSSSSSLSRDVSYSWRDAAADIGNMFKAFIGLNFLYVSFAFSRAGMWRGILGLLFILTLTEHCCHMLVNVKNSLSQRALSDFETKLEEERLERHNNAPYFKSNANESGGPSGTGIISGSGKASSNARRLSDDGAGAFSGKRRSVSFADEDGTLRPPNKSTHGPLKSEHQSNDVEMKSLRRKAEECAPQQSQEEGQDDDEPSSRSSREQSPRPSQEQLGLQLSYGDVARLAHGPNAERFVNTMLVLTQFGFCVGYLIFISSTMHDLMNSELHLYWFILMPAPILCVLALLSSVRSLAPFSNVANLALVIGFVAVLTYCSRHFEWRPSSPSVLTFPLFVGQMTAALEGIALVLPIETSMKDPARFGTVLRVSLVLMGCVLFPVGILGFGVFGEDTKSIILLNMGGSVVVSIVKAVLVVGILFTYPLQLTPVLIALEDWIHGGSIIPKHVIAHDMGGASFETAQLGRLEDYSSQSGSDDGWDDAATTMVEMHEIMGDLPEVNSRDGEDWAMEDIEIQPAAGSERDVETDSVHSVAAHAVASHAGHWHVFVRNPMSILGRIVVVLLTVLIATFAGASFGNFMSLIGSLGAASLAYCMPSFLHLHRFGSQMSFWGKAKDVAILTFGIIAAVVGTVLSIMEMVRSEGNVPL
ncbi:Proton-coupled amino acid transporter 2 [Porphyridium purpureum]|uniref:Proton-coupled amino acid transporter 2 n=1 Tax=Porphyridium purpureum TaxID=35688 RepID=A0A5J4YQ94_PORPP|nr:Proton-coupled amino acid transporter 2 [Porphyridium purpureum]|eukprot:POR6395..scf295_9